MFPSWPADIAFTCATGENLSCSQCGCYRMTNDSVSSTFGNDLSHFTLESTQQHQLYSLGGGDIASKSTISELTLHEMNNFSQFSANKLYFFRQGLYDDGGAWREDSLPQPPRHLFYSCDDLGSRSPPISPQWPDYHSSDDSYSAEIECQSPRGPNLFYSTLECDKVPLGSLIDNKPFSTPRKRRRPLTGLLRHSAKIRTLPAEIQQKGSQQKSKRLFDIPNYKTFKLSKTGSVGLIEMIPTPHIESNLQDSIQKEWVFMDGMNSIAQGDAASNS